MGMHRELTFPLTNPHNTYCGSKEMGIDTVLCHTVTAFGIFNWRAGVVSGTQVTGGRPAKAASARGKAVSWLKILESGNNQGSVCKPFHA